MTHSDTGKALKLLQPVVRDVLGGSGGVLLPALPSSLEGLLGWAMSNSVGGAILWVCDGMGRLEERHRDMLAVAATDSQRERLLYFPSCDTLPGMDVDADDSGMGHRLHALRRLQEWGDTRNPKHEAPVVATCVQALMQRTPTPKILQELTLVLSVGETQDMDTVVAGLVGVGYRHAAEVDGHAQICVKGGVLDVWPLSAEWPLRIEFLGEDIESVRTFNPADQRSIARLSSARIPPAIHVSGPGQSGSLLDYLPDDTVCAWSDFDSVREHAAAMEQAVVKENADGYMDYASLRAEIGARCASGQVVLGALMGDDQFPEARRVDLNVEGVQRVGELSGEFLHPDVMGQHRNDLLRKNIDRARSGWTVYLFMDTDGALDHYARDLAGTPGLDKVRLCVGGLSGGFVLESQRLAVLCEADLVGRPKRAGNRYSPLRGRRMVADLGGRLAALGGLEPGDLVVHSEYGLGRFLGLSEIIFNGESQEVATIEYDDEAKLHVPASQVYLLSRYVGASRKTPRLHKLGGRRWRREKDGVEQAIHDMAASLLETQAQRDALKGYAFGKDKPWQHDFEAAFPFRETPDQEDAIAAVKSDLESERPMDRLICGDAGYGKTEVAMRAAFKAVMDGCQVAVLVPTTVLAQQHYETFLERMTAYPLRIEMLSRFCSHGQRAAIARELEDGSVDIVIGTHALVQPNIRFKNLGLVIIDEEQRFGVEHKERLKQVRKLVDVMTLTATPIPRTLYMSMTGARDMSLIQTPPRERVAIETIVTRNADDTVRKAIKRELSRDGQVFYLYNRVMTIDRARERLERLVPEARITVAHGQMRAGELSRIMHAFVSGEYDVLVCTTIIESGVDIPRVNTILIDRADRFGIADLYQLRGRVGRSNHKAYAYLLLPPSGTVDSDARERIGALRKHSSLSAGFRLALRDLEIRGAGNLLGAEQSGHISAVGFGLYCQLLRRCIAGLRGEAPPRIVDTELRLDFIDLSPRGIGRENAAGIPYDYIEEEGQRLAMYNRLALCAERKDIESLRKELCDRYGLLPTAVLRMLRLGELRIRAADRQVRAIEVRDGKVRLLRHGDYVMRQKRFPRLGGTSVDQCLSEIEALVDSIDQWADS